jgi:hypothetical protein
MAAVCVVFLVGLGVFVWLSGDGIGWRVGSCGLLAWTFRVDGVWLAQLAWAMEQADAFRRGLLVVGARADDGRCVQRLVR